MSDEDRVKPWAQALGRVPSGLFVLSARSGEQETGMLVSWAQQCSFDPPLLTVAMRRGREVAAWLTPGATFVLNVLGEGQMDLLRHFVRGFSLGQPAFEGLAVNRSESAAPVLEKALAYLECQVQSIVPTGDHDLLIARVIGGRLLGEGRPSVHVRKNGLNY